MRLPELVIFDCDGTLVDSERIANEVFAGLITAEGLPTSFAECVERYMGRSASSCLVEIERELGRPLRTDLLRLRAAGVDERLAEELTAIPGIRETLDVLAAAGTAVCVASSSTPTEIEFRLRRTGLAEFFGGAVFSATMVPNGNPPRTSSCTRRRRWAARHRTASWSRTASPGCSRGRAPGCG
ncbi:HAD family phosphatase [Allokutzneria sp. A3M-2-11 16]|nr:HAD family hydrolase [Allokutzneria sp. A3M-2-11 16]MCP3798080.1 HAD family phosphatase [Allokutzneria sp. A3M-2-11 16]